MNTGKTNFLNSIKKLGPEWKKAHVKNLSANITLLSGQLTLDVDDLYGILDQIVAINLGYADPITYLVVDEESYRVLEYKWSLDDQKD